MTKLKNLSEGSVHEKYVISGIDDVPIEMKNFLFTLGCFEGEEVSIVSVLSGNYVISVKNARYSIDYDLAKAILL